MWALCEFRVEVVGGNGYEVLGPRCFLHLVVVAAAAAEVADSISDEAPFQLQY